ncbi:glycosyltransferase family 2 protein [Microbacterium kunmingense]|uniref:glycosyltransferase family 2 protein n=1 Tax=Microbacterium kunmingense TaxID=2915939 RepID=UPI003D73B68A
MTSESTKIPITVLVQTKNEEVGIAACLAGLNAFDEVIVVDSDSTDRTKELAIAAGAKVVNFTWNGLYPKKKQWQLDNLETRNEWVFFIDADETPRPSLIAELRAGFQAGPPQAAAFDINLDYVFAGRLLRHGHRVTKRCLVRRGHVKFPVMDDLDAPGMGELEGHYQPEAVGEVRRAKGRILHNDLDPVSSWFARHNKYSDWEAHLRNKQAARAQVRERRTLKGRVFDAVPLKPLIFFVYAYFLRAGFLDGRAGLDYAVALASYYWQIGLKSRELRASDSVVV